MEHKPNEKKRDARSSMHSMPTWFGITATLHAVSLGRYCPKKIANVKLKSLQIKCTYNTIMNMESHIDSTDLAVDTLNSWSTALSYGCSEEQYLRFT